jgi:hypothetical protein
VPTRKPLYAIGDAAVAGRNGIAVRELHQVNMPIQQTQSGTGIVQGDAGNDKDKKEYIWWSENFHFTTNGKGELIPGDHDADDTPEGSGENPIKILPFVNFAGEQDGTFWAEGGDDLVDTAIKINVGITNVEHIGNSQGYGQLYMTGKNLPKSVKVGPNHCVQLEQEDKDSPAPTIGYLNSNPPLAELKAIIEMKVALMLSTNNLSTSGFSVDLKGNSKSFASGIAMMIDKSESVEDINEQAEIFSKREPKVWKLAYAWLDAYRSSDLLTDEAKALKPVKQPELVMTEFNDAAPVVAETDELTAIEKRKALGMNTMLELIMRDRPGMTEDEAKAKLEEIQAEKQANADAMGLPMGGDPNANPNDPNAKKPGAPGGDVNGNQGQKDGGNFGKNNNNPGSSGGAKNTGSGKDANQA